MPRGNERSCELKSLAVRASVEAAGAAVAEQAILKLIKCQEEKMVNS